MQITSMQIIGECERLAAAYPWQPVNIWACRTPEGKYSFTAYCQDAPDRGLNSAFGHGQTPALAVDNLMQRYPINDPETARQKKIAELQDQIAKLQSVVIGLPPYRPNRELAQVNGELVINKPDTLDGCVTVTVEA